MSLEQWAQIGTLVVAVLAFVISIWGIHSQNKYSKISVSPYLLRNIKMDKLNKRISISIKNTGLGPAFISKVTFEIDDEVQSENFRLTKYTEEIVKKHDLFDELIYSVSEINSGLVIKEGDSLEVLDVRYVFNDPGKEKKLHQLIDSVGYEIEYKSAFGEKKVF